MSGAAINAALRRMRYDTRTEITGPSQPWELGKLMQAYVSAPM